MRNAQISLVFIGQGTPAQAGIFREEHLSSVAAVLLCDPDLTSYRLMRWNRDWWRLLHPLVAWSAVLAVLRGYRQGSLQGDALQNGGVVVTDAEGQVRFQHRAWYPGEPPAASIGRYL